MFKGFVQVFERANGGILFVVVDDKPVFKSAEIVFSKFTFFILYDILLLTQGHNSTKYYTEKSLV